jgi:hypothetical protein
LLYSPQPPIAYTRVCAELGRVGIGVEMQREDMRAQWNLYWLSDPALDNFLADDDQWQTAATIDTELMMACCKATRQQVGGELLSRLLLSLTPEDLVERVLAHDYTHLHPFQLRGNAWILAIRQRSQMFRGALREEGSVVYAAFAKRPTDLKIATTPTRSATIMTLASRKM